MLFRKKNKNTNLQNIPTQNNVFIFIYKGIGEDLMETDTIVAKYEHEAIEQFKTKHPNNELFAYKYDFIDPDTGNIYTFRKNWGYAEYLYRMGGSKTIKSIKQTVDKKQHESDSNINLKPLYYKKNGDYHKTGLYVDPSKLHELFSNLTKETD